MYVYELAIQLGKRSTDLSDAAEAMGLGPMLAAHELSAEERARLLEHFTGVAVPPPPGVAGAAPGAPAGGVGPAPQLVQAGGPGRKVPKAVAVLGGVVAAAVLVGGAYVMVGGKQDELQRHVDAEAAADARGEIPEPEAAAPEGAPAEGAGSEATATTAPVSAHRQMCAAAQQISDLDDQSDFLNTDAPTVAQFQWAMDQLTAIWPETAAAYDQLAMTVPPERRAEVLAVKDGTGKIVASMGAIEAPEQLRAAIDQMNAIALQIEVPMKSMGAFVESECDVELLD